MFFVGFCIATFFVAAFGAGEVSIISSPKTVKFHGKELLDASTLKEVYSAVLGFTTSGNSDWNGMHISNPFHFAEAIVCLVVDGVNSLGKMGIHQFPLNTDEEEYMTWNVLKHRVHDRFYGLNNTLVRSDLSEIQNSVEPVHPVFGDIEIHPDALASHALDMNETEANDLLMQLAVLKGIAQKVMSGGFVRDGLPDVYWFFMPGLHPVVDLHGTHSPAALEAKQHVIDAIDEIKNAFQKGYDDHFLFTVVTSDVSHTRQTRSLKAANEDPTISGLNLSKDYGPDYPVIFNILLWFMVAFTFSILAVSIGIASMDPGRDSIIYRMTSNRMKKDN